MADEEIIVYTNEINGQKIKEIFVPSLELIANVDLTSNGTKIRALNMKSSKHAEYFVKLSNNSQKAIIDHKPMKVSKEFIDSIRDIRNYEQRLNKSKIDLFSSKDFKCCLGNNY